MALKSAVSRHKFSKMQILSCHFLAFLLKYFLLTYRINFRVFSLLPEVGNLHWRKTSGCLLEIALCVYQRAKQRGTLEGKALLELGSGEVLMI